MTHARRAPLWAALLLSVLAHAITLSGGWLQLPQTQADPQPLLVRLEPVAPTPALTPVPAKPRPVRAQPAAVAVAAAPITVKSDAPAPWSMPATVAEPVAEAVAETDSATMTAPTDAAAPTPEPVVVATAAPSTYAPEPVTIKSLPRRGRIAYALNYYLSSKPTLIGRTVQTWESSDKAYKLDSLSETVGLARLTKFGPRTYQSSGVVTARGLQPQSFTAKVMVSGKSDDSAAQFDWDNHTLRFGDTANTRDAALLAGSQDLLSFMYQLALAPPPRGRLQLPVTTGSRFETYELDVLDEETIETPLGNVRALPVKQLRQPGKETLEVWLAAEYHYLPVRIRIINRDGTLGGEQVATEISVGEQ